MATFPDIAPDYGLSKESAPKARRAEFGDGYEQRLRFGLNQNPKVWPLSWTNISRREADQIDAFLDARADDCQSFDWMPPDRVNLLAWTEQLDNAYWTKFRTSIVANATAAPDGLVTADKIVEDTTTAGHTLSRQNITFKGGKVYTLSGYFKAAERSRIRLRFGNGGIPFPVSTAHQAEFNLTLGTVVSSGSSVSSSVIRNEGNGWYRCAITAVAQFSGVEAAFAPLLVDNAGSASYTGDGVSGVFGWGIQLEECSPMSDYQMIEADKAYKWVCEEWNRQLTAFNLNTVTAKFREVFEA